MFDLLGEETDVQLICDVCVDLTSDAHGGALLRLPPDKGDTGVSALHFYLLY